MHEQPIVQSYLSFDGNCEEALKFYERALEAKLLFLMRFKESPEPPPPGAVPPNWGEKIMHASLQIGQSTVMASDGCAPNGPNFRGFYLSLGVSTEAEAEKAFAALAEGGKVQMPLNRTFFAPKFGMLTDRFGVGWMVIVRTADQPK